MINSTAFADSEAKKEKRNQTIAFVEKHGPQMFLRSFAPSLLSSKHRETGHPAVEKLLRITSGTTQRALISYTQAMRDRSEKVDMLGQLPVLFVGGEEDELVPASHSKEHEPWLEDGNFHLLADCGHVSMLEQPQQVLRLIHQFLDKLS
jgi:pimeloyl-ACP methyl ester carboxylesterase